VGWGGEVKERGLGRGNGNIPDKHLAPEAPVSLRGGHFVCFYMSLVSFDLSPVRRRSRASAMRSCFQNCPFECAVAIFVDSYYAQKQTAVYFQEFVAILRISTANSLCAVPACLGSDDDADISRCGSVFLGGRSDV
jgi:hypothetical protein